MRSRYKSGNASWAPSLGPQLTQCLGVDAPALGHAPSEASAEFQRLLLSSRYGPVRFAFIRIVRVGGSPMLRLAVAVLVVALAGTANAGWRSMRIDGSSETGFAQSVAALQAGLSPARRYVFD